MAAAHWVFPQLPLSHWTKLTVLYKEFGFLYTWLHPHCSLTHDLWLQRVTLQFIQPSSRIVFKAAVCRIWKCTSLASAQERQTRTRFQTSQVLQTSPTFCQQLQQFLWVGLRKGGAILPVSEPVKWQHESWRESRLLHFNLRNNNCETSPITSVTNTQRL